MHQEGEVEEQVVARVAACLLQLICVLMTYPDLKGDCSPNTSVLDMKDLTAFSILPKFPRSNQLS